MKRKGFLFRKIIDCDNLGRAYLSAIRGKSFYTAVQKFIENDIENIERIRESLIDRSFTTGRYREKFVFEPKKRTLYILPFAPDRIVQHALMSVLVPILDKNFIYDSYACRKGKGQHAGSRRCMEFIRKATYCLKCDIEKFYPSVNHEILKDKFRKKIKCKDTLWLLDDIIDSFDGGKNVPIGNYTSQWFANFYMTDLDYYIKQVLKIKYYIRYCDDFVLFHNDKKYLHYCKNAISNYCEEKLKLKFSKADVFPCSRGVDYLGYRHFPSGYILLRKSTAKRQKRKIAKLQKMVELNKITNPKKALSQIASMLGWVRHSNSYNFRRALGVDNLYKHLKLESRKVAA